MLKTVRSTAATRRGIAVTSDSSTAARGGHGHRSAGKVEAWPPGGLYIGGVGLGPRHRHLPDDRSLYVTLSKGGQVAKVDVATGRVVSGWRPGPTAFGDISTDGTALYVVNYRTATSPSSRTSDMKVLMKEPAGHHPIGITYDDFTGRVWVANYQHHRRVGRGASRRDQDDRTGPTRSRRDLGEDPVAELVVARNPDGDSPAVPAPPAPRRGRVGAQDQETWPRTAKVYHPSDDWPDEARAQIVRNRWRSAPTTCAGRGGRPGAGPGPREPLAVRVRPRPGPRGHLLADRPHQPPGPAAVSVPTRRASGRTLEILVDSHERYAWKFNKQQATTRRQALAAGDYAVESGGSVLAAVERKGMADLVGTMSGGRLRYLLAPADVPSAALVVEDRFSSVFKQRHVAPSTIAEGLAEAQVRFPTVPHRVLRDPTAGTGADLPTRFLGAALDHADEDEVGSARTADIPTAAPVACGSSATRGPGLGREEDRDLGPGRVPGSRRRGLPARPLSTSPPVRAPCRVHAAPTPCGTCQGDR